MRMSDQQKENWKYLFVAVGAIAMLLISVWLREYVDEQKSVRDKIDLIYIQSVTSHIRDSLHSESIARLNIHQEQTDEKITQMMQAILQAQIQLTENSNNKKIEQNHN